MKSIYITLDLEKLLEKNKIIIETDKCFDSNGEIKDKKYFTPNDLKNLYSAPLLSDVQQWFREEKKLHIEPTLSCSNNTELPHYWTFIILDIHSDESIFESYMKSISEGDLDKEIECSSYEDALIKGIKKVLS